MENKIRLAGKIIRDVKDSVLQLDFQTRIFVFGYQCDLNKRGGYIDLLITANKVLNYCRKYIKDI